MVSAIISKNNKNWKVLWNKGLVFLFLATFFLDGITRYKHMITVLMVITSLYYFYKSPKECLALFKNNLFYAIAALSIALLYSIFISPDVKISFKEFNNTVLKGTLFFTLCLPIILKDESLESLARLILISFIASLCIRSAVELVLYYSEYRNGIRLFSNFNHRHISDSMVFLFPALLNIWLFKKKSYKIGFLILSCIFLFLLLGTLSRGAWLAVLITAICWLVFNRLWKLSLVLVFSVIIGMAGVMQLKHGNDDKLLVKLQQTDSSDRYVNGTQGSAWSLIMENPIKGYGYGDDIYHATYNKRIVDYPAWTFKESIGPHNLALYLWFSAGIFGLISLIYVYYAVIKETAAYALRNTTASPYNVHLLLLLSLIGFFIIRGNFEQIELDPLGIIVGLLLALKQVKNNRAM